MEFFCCSWYRCDIKPSDFLDLPNLKTIMNSDGNSFQYIYTVKLESTISNRIMMMMI